MRCVITVIALSLIASLLYAEELFEFEQFGTPIDQAEIIVIHFHGFGDDAQNQKGLGDIFAKDLTQPLCLLAIQGRYPLADGDGASWFSQDRTESAKVLTDARQFVRNIQSQHATKTVIVGGFSQGAALTTALITDETVAIDGAYVWGGFLMTPPNQTWPKHSKIFVFHGEKDEATPFKPMKHWCNQLTKHGIDAEFYSEPDVGHHLSATSFARTVAFIKRVHTEKAP